nr:MAG TPA: hypothetical protein [Caudoviricetes sp.]
MHLVLFSSFCPCLLYLLSFLFYVKAYASTYLALLALLTIFIYCTFVSMTNAGISTFEGSYVTHIKIFNNCTFFERRPFCYVRSLSTPTGAGVTAFLFFKYVI